MMKKVILVRHGATDWNITGRLTSFTDLELNDQGHSEALKLGDHLRVEFPNASVWSSGAQRAKQTADAILRARGDNHQVRILPDAAEANFGRFEGKIPADFAGTPEGSHYTAWQEGHRVEDDVESLNDVGKRAKSVYSRLLEDDSPDSRILVTHGVFIRVLICVNVLDLSPSAYRRLTVDNASTSVIQISDKTVRLVQLNNRPFF